jgi:hypothetical protein
MDADFSVRNEVDSIRPPYEDKVNYSHQDCPYDDIISNINNAPPFPSAPLNSGGQSYGTNPYSEILRQQSYLLSQQQIMNTKLVAMLTKEDSVKWKYIALAFGGILLILLWPKFYSSRKNPKVVYLGDNRDY